MSEAGKAVKLPQYKCHKVVGALEITLIVENPNGGVDVFFTQDDPIQSVNIEQPDAGRFTGKDKRDWGFYVEYRDGYISWSPTEEFLDGYTLIT